MSPLPTLLRLIHIFGGVYWAGSIFFFVTFLEPSIRSLGPDGGKVMIRLFERGFLNLMPVVAIVTILSGLWLLWILSAGFSSDYMGSAVGIALSGGAAFAIVAFITGLTVMRPAANRVWAIARQLPTESDDAKKKSLMAEMDRVRARAGLAGRIVFALLIGAVAMMSVARYI
jgi:uncharacterized membrane protein